MFNKKKQKKIKGFEEGENTVSNGDDINPQTIQTMIKDLTSVQGGSQVRNVEKLGSKEMSRDTSQAITENVQQKQETSPFLNVSLEKEKIASQPSHGMQEEIQGISGQQTEEEKESNKQPLEVPRPNILSDKANVNIIAKEDFIPSAVKEESQNVVLEETKRSMTEESSQPTSISKQDKDRETSSQVLLQKQKDHNEPIEMENIQERVKIKKNEYEEKNHPIHPIETDRSKQEPVRSMATNESPFVVKATHIIDDSDTELANARREQIQAFPKKEVLSKKQKVNVDLVPPKVQRTLTLAFTFIFLIFLGGGGYFVWMEFGRSLFYPVEEKKPPILIEVPENPSDPIQSEDPYKPDQVNEYFSAPNDDFITIRGDIENSLAEADSGNTYYFRLADKDAETSFREHFPLLKSVLGENVVIEAWYMSAYVGEEGVRFGLIIDPDDLSRVRNNVRNNESATFEAVSELYRTTDEFPLEYDFINTSYNAIPIRYMNFGQQRYAFDYATTDTYLLISSSKTSMFDLIDTVDGVMSGKGAQETLPEMKENGDVDQVIEEGASPDKMIEMEKESSEEISLEDPMSL